MKNLKTIGKAVALWAEILLYGKVWAFLLCIITLICGLIPAVKIMVFGAITTAFLDMTGNWIKLLFFVGVYLLLDLLNNIIPTITQYLVFRVNYETDIYASEKLYHKILSLDYRYREQPECVRLVSHSEAALSPYRIVLILEDTSKMLTYCINLVSIFIILVQINVVITVLYLVFLVLSVVVMTKSMKNYNSFMMSKFEKDRVANQYKENLYDINKVIDLKVYNAFEYMYEKWKMYKAAVDRENIRHQGKRDFGYIGSMYLVGDVFLVVSLLIYLLSGGMSVTHASQIFEAVRNMSGIANQLSIIFGVRATDMQYYEAYAVLQEKKERTAAQVKGKSKDSGDVVVENMSFHYSDNGFGLKNINMNFRKGKRTAIVGYNGSGKSTLVKLLLGLYQPESGTVSCASAECATVFQDYLTYNMSLRENIAFGALDHLHDDDKILIAAQNAGIRYLLDNHGIDAEIGTEFGGLKFSGGESQRLAIARAYMKEQCGLVILDEPVSAIDALEESAFLHKLMEYTADKTSVIVTHRLSMTVAADYIYVMENGEVAEEGTHAELMAKEGLYYRMFSMQAANYVG